MVKICGISDLHGIISFNIEECDVLCICGDIVPLNIQGWTDESYKWLKNDFLTWCNNQPCKEVLLIGGNHDFAIFRHPDKIRDFFRDTKIKYLSDEEYSYISDDGDVIKFYGTAWCHQFGNWAFMGYSDEELKKIYLRMPDDVDILLTHDCPYGACDVLLQKDVFWANGDHIGGKGLADAIIEKKPKMNLTGHLHSTNHEGEMLGDTFVCNVSVLDEHYKRVYEPHYFEVEKHEEFKINKH